MESQLKQSDDLLHKENVKVYRNVQAALIEELGKQTQELREIVESQPKPQKNTAQLVISIVILLGVLGNLAVSLIPYLKFLLF